jgi:radical SAM superfamily enzyme YgiQ (UPF0313 family)
VYPYRDEIGKDAGHFPPLGLEIIASMLAKHAESLEIIDLRRDAGATADHLRPDTDLVCFSVNWDMEIGFIRSEIAAVPEKTLTIVGGRHATEDPEEWLTFCPNVDIVVRGDGEEIIEDFLGGRPLEEITGISYRVRETIVHNKTRTCGALRNDIYPDRRLRRHDWTLNLWGLPSTLSFDTVSSSRGCPFKCSFCSFNRSPWGEKRNWSARSPESVVEEIEKIEAEAVGFVDDNFTHDMDRVSAICDLLQKRGIRKKYGINARLEIARRPEVLRKMRKVGFSMLLLGIESAQDKTLRSMNKGFDRKRIREYFQVLRKTGMILHGYFIVGAIGETEAEMRQIAPFANDLGVDTMTLCILRNERYSGIDELVAESPGYHIAADGTVYSDRHSVQELEQLCHEIYCAHYNARTILRIARKGLTTGFFRPSVLLSVPRLLLTRPWIEGSVYGRVGIGDERRRTADMA